MSSLFIILFIASILTSIGIHEFGHFITAKRFGIKVHEFFIGFGPRIWSIRKGETEYGVKGIPLGGYVKIAGMNPLEEISAEDAGRVFKAKKPWKRAIVLGAGSFTHFVIGLVIIFGILWLAGIPQFSPTNTVSAVSRDTAAQRAGIMVDDTIVEVDGAAVGTWEEVIEEVQKRGGREVTIIVRRDGRRLALRPVELDIKPLEDGRRVGFLGVGPELEQTGLLERGFFPALGESFKQTGFLARDSLFAFREIFSPSKIAKLFRVAAGDEERGLDDPATLVGVGKIAGDFGTDSDWVGLFSLIAGFNIFIGVANLLPLPPLDGGHLAVLAYEKATSRDVDMRKLLPVTATVIALFGSLFVLLLFLDIARPLPNLPG
ncbi:MAG TPA: M50 family metallopeptidase [Actinomycetota bacterium]